MTLYRWSQSQGSNAGADSTINWAEGQAPSTVNDSARAMMAATAKYRDDIAGAIVTAGTSTAYTVSSYEVFDTLAHLNGQVIGFTPHVTNGATVTLNVDSLGAKPLRPAPSVELQSGVLIQGTPYVAVYNNSDGVFYLRGVGPAPGIPLGAGMDYWGATAPSTAFAFAAGQVISQSTYALLFSLIGPQYNIGGEGAGTFRLPDKRARVSACPDNMGGSDALRFSNVACAINSARNLLGGNAGEAQHTLAINEMPSHSHANALTDPGHLHSASLLAHITGQPVTSGSGSAGQGALSSGNTDSATTGITIVNASTGGGVAHNLMQPTILCNYVIRVL
jgi:microcystin-dependent protein